MSGAPSLLTYQRRTPLLEDGFTAGDAKHGARDVTGIRWRGKEDVGWCNFGGLACAAQRSVLTELGEMLGILCCWLQGSPNRARCHGIDADSPFTDLAGKVHREVIDCSLG